jgi:serine/threonine protein kinase
LENILATDSPMPLSDFRVVEALGKGSFASVYKVMRKSDNKVYALKRVKIGKMSKKEIADALNEIRFLASIRHKNIVGFLESFLENNESELCIVMEVSAYHDLSRSHSFLSIVVVVISRKKWRDTRDAVSILMRMLSGDI